MQIFINLISIVLLLQVFVSNEVLRIYSPLILSIISLSCVLLLIYHHQNIRIRFSKTNIALAVFILLNIVLLFDSIYVTGSLSWLIFYIQCFIFFIFFQQFASQQNLLFLSKTFVILTAIFGIFSFTNFIEIGLLSNLRLDGVVGPSGVYAGFLILPLFLSFYFIIRSHGLSKQLWYVTASIILASLFLTFSISAWIVTGIALIIIFIIYIQNLKPILVDKRKDLAKTILAVFLLSFVIFSGVWYFARQTMLMRDGQAMIQASLYEKSLEKDGFWQTRYQNLVDASTAFLRSPITGFGLGQYAGTIQTLNLQSYSYDFGDPHNWFLKMLVENGVISTFVFVLFIIFFFRESTKNKSVGMLYLVVLTGLLSLVLHSFTEADLSQRSVMLIWFVFAGLAYGSDWGVLGEGPITKLPNYILLVITLFMTIISIQFVRADITRIKGDYYFNNKNYDYALNSYFKALTYNSHDKETWYRLGRVYKVMNRQEQAESSFLKSKGYFPPL